MKKSRLLVALGALALAGLAGGLFLASQTGWSSRNETVADGPKPALTLFGNVDIRQIALAFDGSGRVTAMQAEEGDRVRAGASLARIDTRRLVLQARQLEADIEAQRQAVLQLRNGARPEELEQARSRLAAAEAETERDRRDLSRLQDLWKRGSGSAVSRENLDHAASQLRVSRAQSDELRTALRLIELGPRPEEIAAAQAQLASLQARLAQLQLDIDRGELKAPTDAVVRSRLVEPGDMITSQRPVLTLALMQPKWVRVFVPEPDLGRISPGMAAEIVTDSHPGAPLAGKVGHISSVAEFTPKSVQTEALRTRLVYEVRIVVDDPEDRLRLGQPATVRLYRDARP